MRSHVFQSAGGTAHYRRARWPLGDGSPARHCGRAVAFLLMVPAAVVTMLMVVALLPLLAAHDARVGRREG